MKITATYVWTVNVMVEVANTATEEEQRKALDDAALNAKIDQNHPIMHDCSNPDLID
jgi:hypothetical protein